MDFNNRLQKAIERGQRASDARARAEAEKTVNEKEFQRLHSQYRRELTERIESCVSQIADRFPGFRFETIVSEDGWGAAIGRDDIDVRSSRRRTTHFSYLEMVIRPFSSSHVLDLAAKATVRNKELFNRTHYQRLTEIDLTSFTEMVDNWALEYAEVYSAKS